MASAVSVSGPASAILSEAQAIQSASGACGVSCHSTRCLPGRHSGVVKASASGKPRRKKGEMGSGEAWTWRERWALAAAKPESLELTVLQGCCCLAGHRSFPQERRCPREIGQGQSAMALGRALAFSMVAVLKRPSDEELAMGLAEMQEKRSAGGPGVAVAP